MIASTVQRVPAHTSKAVNERILRNTERSVAQYVHAGEKAIQERLDQLDREWDIERVLEANAASACLLGLTLGATVSRKWFVVPVAVAGFLLQHAIQGWCPPLPVMRRLGFRTAAEINYERNALKALRGDFDQLGTGASATIGTIASKALAAARR